MSLTRIVFIVMLCLHGVAALACSCLIPPQFNTKEDLKEYNIIALVEIKGLAPKDEFGRKANGNIEIEVKELFKGAVTTRAVDPSFNTSCAATLNEGEQWLFFGNEVTGVFQLDVCSHSSRYRDTNGMREWWAMRDINNLENLRVIFKSREAAFSDKIYYANGKTEIAQKFRNGKINGIRKIYYPSGKLYIQEKFVNGERDDYRKTFAESGQLLEHVTYKRGLKSKVISYHDTLRVKEQLIDRSKYINFPLLDAEPDQAKVKRALDSLIKTVAWLHSSSEVTYGPDHRSYQAISYYPSGSVGGKLFVDWAGQTMESYSYDEAGNLTSHSKMDNKARIKTEEDYKSDGSRKDFVEKCMFCEIYFNSNTAPEAAPEKIFIR